MGRNKKYKRRAAEDFLRYSGNEMTGRERNIFEKDLQKDPFGAEAMEGLSSVSPGEARRDLADLHQRLSDRTQHKNRLVFYRVAAAVAAMIVIGSLVIMVTKIGLFPGQVAFTETTEQKNQETMQSQEILIEPGSEKSMSEEEISRSDVATDMQTTKKPLTKSQDLVTIPEASEKEMSVEVKEQIYEPLVSAMAEQKEMEITDELKGIIMKDDKTEPVPMDEIVDIAVKEESKPSLSRNKAMTAGEGNISSGKIRTTLVRGVVVSSEDNLPISGAIVSVKGTQTGSVTDHNGNFEISLQEDTSHLLVADFIGMKRKEIEMSDEQDVRITMDPLESELNELVVIGYGVQKKGDITGAISIIKMDENYQTASPVPGFRKFRDYIEDNIHYPPEHQLISREVVVLSFMVDKEGRPKDIFILKSPGKEFTEESIRLLMNGPDWFPPKRDGVEVEEETRIRIVFRPDP